MYKPHGVHEKDITSSQRVIPNRSEQFFFWVTPGNSASILII